MKPIASAHFSPVQSSSGVTCNWKVELADRAAGHGRGAVAVEDQPGDRAADQAAEQRQQHRLEHHRHHDRQAARSRSRAASRSRAHRAATAANMVLSAPNIAPMAMIAPTAMPSHLDELVRPLGLLADSSRRGVDIELELRVGLHRGLEARRRPSCPSSRTVTATGTRRGGRCRRRSVASRPELRVHASRRTRTRRPPSRAGCRARPRCPTSGRRTGASRPADDQLAHARE